ncbi:MAG: hypothetical protein ACOC6D_02140, partial [Atribacterota bacterium]
MKKNPGEKPSGNSKKKRKISFVNDELSILLYHKYFRDGHKLLRPEKTENILRRSLHYKVSTNNVENLERVVKSGTEPELFALLQALERNPEITTDKATSLIALIGRSYFTDFALGRLLGSLVDDDNSWEELLSNILKSKWSETNNKRLLESLLKVAMLSNIDILSEEDIKKIAADKIETDLILAFSDYCSLFKKSSFLPYISSLFAKISKNNPALGFFLEDNIYELDTNKVAKNCNNSSLFCQWLELSNFLKNTIDDSATTVLQFMFYGDPSMSGKKNTGGLTTFLIALGNELAKKMNLITIGVLPVVKPHVESMYEAIAEHHALLRIPLYIASSNQNEFIEKFSHVKRIITRVLKLASLDRQIVHLRYSDHASLAATEASKELNNKICFTVTTDPHIKMIDVEGKLANVDLETAGYMLSRLNAAEEIIKLSDRL